MTQQISQLKDEIKAKDASIHQEQLDKGKYAEENAKIDADIGQKKKEIEAYEMTIKT